MLVDELGAPRSEVKPFLQHCPGELLARPQEAKARLSEWKQFCANRRLSSWCGILGTVSEVLLSHSDQWAEREAELGEFFCPKTLRKLFISTPSVLVEDWQLLQEKVLALPYITQLPILFFRQ